MSILFTPQKIEKMMLKNMEGKFDLEERYNLEAAKRIKPVMKASGSCKTRVLNRYRATKEENSFEKHTISTQKSNQSI